MCYKKFDENGELNCGHWASHKFPYQEALREIIKALVLMNNHEEDYILYALDGMEIPLI